MVLNKYSKRQNPIIFSITFPFESSSLVKLQSFSKPKVWIGSVENTQVPNEADRHENKGETFAKFQPQNRKDEA